MKINFAAELQLLHECKVEVSLVARDPDDQFVQGNSSPCFRATRHSPHSCQGAYGSSGTRLPFAITLERLHTLPSGHGMLGPDCSRSGNRSVLHWRMFTFAKHWSSPAPTSPQQVRSNCVLEVTLGPRLGRDVQQVPLTSWNRIASPQVRCRRSLLQNRVFHEAHRFPSSCMTCSFPSSLIPCRQNRWM